MPPMSPLNRRHFLGALAAIPAAWFLRPAAERYETVIMEQRLISVHTRLPIVFGEISDELMPKPPYYRAHCVGDNWHACPPLFDQITRLELIES